jgi:endonuclease G
MSTHRRRLALTLLLLALALLLAGWPARAQPSSVHLTMGNPSGAVADAAQSNNYLIVREQYALAYSRDRGTPNWVSWHLEAADLGAAPRYSGNFITDTSLPAGWYRITHGDYTGSGYDRGHMTPSADRTASIADNQGTFILTNVLPQAPENNQGLWAQLEEHARALVVQGDELYIISGGSGALNALAGGKLTVPAAVWKVMLVLPAATGDDVARVTAQTQVIAVWTPNDATTAGRTWQSYQTTVACVEQRSDLDFFATVEDSVEAAIEGGPCPNQLYLPLIRNGELAATAGVHISFIDYAPATGPTDEYVAIRNEGGSPADLAGWTLRDLAGTTYIFPAFSLAVGAEVRVWTRVGMNDAGNLYWGRTQAVWNNSGGDSASLRNAGGAEVDSYSYN